MVSLGKWIHIQYCLNRLQMLRCNRQKCWKACCAGWTRARCRRSGWLVVRWRENSLRILFAATASPTLGAWCPSSSSRQAALALLLLHNGAMTHGVGGALWSWARRKVLVVSKKREMNEREKNTFCSFPTALQFSLNHILRSLNLLMISTVERWC